MHPVDALCAEEECTELTPVHATHLVGKDPRPPDVLGRVRSDSTVDMSKTVEATYGGQSAVDGRRSEATFLEGGSIELDVAPGGREDLQAGIGCPLKVGPEVVAVGVERAVASQKPAAARSAGLGRARVS
jgi:hypothetical protein